MPNAPLPNGQFFISVLTSAEPARQSVPVQADATSLRQSHAAFLQIEDCIAALSMETRSKLNKTLTSAHTSGFVNLASLGAVPVYVLCDTGAGHRSYIGKATYNELKQMSPDMVAASGASGRTVNLAGSNTQLQGAY